ALLRQHSPPGHLSVNDIGALVLDLDRLEQGDCAREPREERGAGGRRREAEPAHSPLAFHPAALGSRAHGRARLPQPPRRRRPRAGGEGGGGGVVCRAARRGAGGYLAWRLPGALRSPLARAPPRPLGSPYPVALVVASPPGGPRREVAEPQPVLRPLAVETH